MKLSLACERAAWEEEEEEGDVTPSSSQQHLSEHKSTYFSPVTLQSPAPGRGLAQGARGCGRSASPFRHQHPCCLPQCPGPSTVPLRAALPWHCQLPGLTQPRVCPRQECEARSALKSPNLNFRLAEPDCSAEIIMIAPAWDVAELQSSSRPGGSSRPPSSVPPKPSLAEEQSPACQLEQGGISRGA